MALNNHNYYRPKITWLLAIIFLLNLACKGPDSKVKNTDPVPKIENEMNVAYIGTYTKKEGHVDGKADGIYTIYQDVSGGSIEFGTLVAPVINPSFVITSRDKKNLYAVSELGPGDDNSGFIHSFSINPDHSLVETGKISTEGFAPCHISEDTSGRFVFVANYVGGVVMMYSKENDGSLKMKQKITLEDPENSHPHSVNIAANNKDVYITDLGKSRIYFYTLSADEGSLQPKAIPFLQLEEGTGPRHFEFSLSQKYAFTINEHASTIGVFKIAASGELSLLQIISTLPKKFTGNNTTADIHLHPSGKFLYGSNRGHNSIVSYKFNEETGQLELTGFTSSMGEKPRNFAITLDGKYMYVANQDSDNIAAYVIDQNNGILKEIEAPIEVKTPVCISFK